MSEFLLVSFDFEGRQIPEEKLTQMFNLAKDWVRYAPNCWIIYTSKTPDEWYERAKRRVNADDGIFICALDLENRAGFLPQKVWDWISKDRS